MNLMTVSRVLEEYMEPCGPSHVPTTLSSIVWPKVGLIMNICLRYKMAPEAAICASCASFSSELLRMNS